MAKQEKREERTIVVISTKTGREVDAVILGTRGVAPAKDRKPLLATVRSTLDYAQAQRC